MKIQEKPDYLIFADSAKKGENAEFPDISRGWGITIEQTASKPPMEWMNGSFNRIDKNILYLLQQGVPEWSEKVTYPVNAIIKYNGVLYTAIAENDNARPSTNTTKWKKTQAEIPIASTAQEGIVKLNSATNSESQTEAATSLAVKKTYDLASFIIDTFRPLDFESVIFSPDKMYHAVVRNDGVLGLYNSHTNNLVWSIGPDGGLYDGYVNTDKIPGLNNFIAQTNNNLTFAHNRISNINNKFGMDDFESAVFSGDKNNRFVVRNDGLTGVYSESQKKFIWYFTDEGWLVGYVAADRIGGLDQFVRDRMLPSGIPQAWPSDNIPNGWFLCNGAPFDVNQFPRLASVYPWGTLPDLRGLFIRGKDNGRGLDPDRAILSFQDDAIRNIWGEVWPISETFGQNGGTCTGAFAAYSKNASGTPKKVDWSDAGGFNFDASRVVPVSHDNHPRNVAFNYIVRAE